MLNTPNTLEMVDKERMTQVSDQTTAQYQSYQSPLSHMQGLGTWAEVKTLITQVHCASLYDGRRVKHRLVSLSPQPT